MLCPIVCKKEGNVKKTWEILKSSVKKSTTYNFNIDGLYLESFRKHISLEFLECSDFLVALISREPCNRIFATLHKRDYNEHLTFFSVLNRNPILKSLYQL